MENGICTQRATRIEYDKSSETASLRRIFLKVRSSLEKHGIDTILGIVWYSSPPTDRVPLTGC